MESKITPELLEKAKQAKSAEELLTLAKENDIELTEENAKAYFEQFKYYDFNDGFYEDTLVPMYKALVENQKNAKTFKELVNSYNNNFTALQEAVNKNLRDHEAIVAELRSYLRYIPEDLSEINYSYSNVVSAIQRIYGGMNDYEKNLLSDKGMVKSALNIPSPPSTFVERFQVFPPS